MIKRSYSVLRFLNRRHIWPLRVAAAGVGALCAFAVTGRTALAREAFGQFYNGSFKLGGRRTGFYLRAGWPRMQLADDPFFNFAEGMGEPDLKELESWLKTRERASSAEVYAGDMMLVHAALGHLSLEAGAQSRFEQHLTAFKAQADRLLAAVAAKPDQYEQVVPAEIKDTPGFAEDAAQVLQDFERDLPSETWGWFVVGGTLLGLVRDNGFLAHDVDLDTGLFLEGLDLEALVAVFERSEVFSIAKFDYQTEIYRTEDGQAALRRVPGMLKLVHANGINMDVFLHERRDGKIWHGSGVNKWVNAPFELKAYTLAGLPVLGPADADTYLREHYGDWRVVVKDFSCITGTTNLTFVKNLSTIAVLLKRYARFSATRPMEAAKVMRELTEQGYVQDTATGRVLANRLV